MKQVKRFLCNFSAVVLTLSATAGIVSAQPEVNTDKDRFVPEKNGTYDDPGNPGIKVRVFVHVPNPKAAPAPSNPVCNLADPESTAAVGAAGWHLAPNVTYNLNPSSVPSSVGASNLRTIVSNGFTDWSSATEGAVTFTEGSTTTVDRSANDGKNVIAWGRTSGSALGVTYIRYNTTTGVVVDVDTIMNKKFVWSWSVLAGCANSGSYDAENIMTHELGHWLGLDDEYDPAFQDSTMFGYGAKGEVKKNSLTTGDKAGVFAIYNN
jgi:hypothetical protein